MAIRGHRFFLLPLAALVLLASCTPGIKKPESGYIIRYCDIRAVYSYIASRDAGVKKLKAREKRLQAERNRIEDMQLGDSSNKKIQAMLFNNSSKLRLLNGKKKSAKGKIMSVINSILEDVAKESGADFILNYGEGLLYSRRGYDVTEKVIRLYRQRLKRSNPLSR